MSREYVTLPDDDHAPQWDIEEKRDGDRTWYTIHHVGWVVAEAYYGGYGWRCSTRPLEPIPDEVMEALPAGARDAIERRS